MKEKDYSLLFHKGKTKKPAFGKISEEYLLIAMFGEEIFLGLPRLKASQTIKKIEDVFKG